MGTSTSEDEDYITAIQRAADGEVQGEILFKRLAEQAGPEHRHKLDVLARLEIRTARELDELVRRYAIAINPSNERKAEERARKYDGMLFHDILEEWSTWIPDYVNLYDRLAERARPADKDALSFLAAHERAIDKFIALELAGRSEEAIAELNALLKT
jgi:hypothetical protein